MKTVSQTTNFDSAMAILFIIGLLVSGGYFWGNSVNKIVTSDTEYALVTIEKLTQTSSGCEVTVHSTVPGDINEWSFSVNAVLFNSLKLNQSIEVVKLNNKWRVVYPID